MIRRNQETRKARETSGGSVQSRFRSRGEGTRPAHARNRNREIRVVGTGLAQRPYGIAADTITLQLSALYLPATGEGSTRVVDLPNSSSGATRCTPTRRNSALPKHGSSTPNRLPTRSISPCRARSAFEAQPSISATIWRRPDGDFSRRSRWGSRGLVGGGRSLVGCVYSGRSGAYTEHVRLRAIDA